MFLGPFFKSIFLALAGPYWALKKKLGGPPPFPPFSAQACITNLIFYVIQDGNNT